MGWRCGGCIWLWFGKMARLVLVNLVAFVVVSASADETTTDNYNYRQERQSDFDPNPIFGVASVAGITSRNGRISSTGGVHFYPTPGDFSTNGDGYYHPLTFTKAIDGKYATGSVQIHPGALGVSSSASSGYVDPEYFQMDPWPRQWQWPGQNQFYGHLPWFNNVKFELPQSRDVKRRWMYPSFNPFLNFWR